jgi:hypothetical protein
VKERRFCGLTERFSWDTITFGSEFSVGFSRSEHLHAGSGLFFGIGALFAGHFGHFSRPSKAFASRKSAVSNPSLNEL